MNQETNYLIPANSKRSMLILGYFRPLDLGIFAIGLCTSLLFLLIIEGNSIFAVMLKLFPGLFATFLVLPLPNYHNVRILIREIYEFIMNRRVYIWKGWCFTSEFDKKQR